MSNTLAKQRAVPRHAASLILYRQGAKDIEVLMGRRAKAHRFLPDVFVFPGGRLDKSDFDHPVKSPLKQPVADRLSQPGDMATALACAAVRETYEETGLILGDLQQDELAADLSGLNYIARAITPSESPIRFNSRFLIADASSVTGELGGSGELIDLGWYGLSEALRMPVVDVTEFLLEEMQYHSQNGLPDVTHFSLFTYINGISRIRRETL